MKFKNKNVLITGGSKGIGRGCVEAFLKEGANVWFTCRKIDDSLASWTKSNKNIHCLELDSVAPNFSESIRNIFGIGPLDILINNVGDVIKRSSFEASSLELWEDCLKLNLISAITATQALLDNLKKSTSSSIINVSSIAAASSGAGDSLHYGVAKAALNSFTYGLAKELGKYNIRVNAVAPSAVDTEFQKRNSSQSRLDNIINQTPLNRMGTIADVVAPIQFLCSDEAKYITGECLYIDGGR